MKTVNPLVLGLLALASLLLTSCEPPGQSVKGLVLPEGNIEVGQANFVALKCHRCHKVYGIELPEYVAPVSERIWDDPIELGGKIVRVKTYGELVTSIINPDHIVSPEYKEYLAQPENQSPMPNLGGNMTVAQLIDLVAFLHSRYEKLEAYTYETLPY